MKLTHPSLNAGLAVVVSIVTLPIPTTAATAAPPALPAPVGGPATVETPSTVRTIPLHPPQGRALSRAESASTIAEVPPGATAPFSMLGVTWADAHRPLGATAQVRTRSVATGAWSAWRTLDTDDESGDGDEENARSVRGSTDPLWVGTSNGIAVRVVSASGAVAAGPPAGLRVDLIDPGTAKPGTETETPAISSRAESAGTAFPRPPLRVVTRAAWGANESIVKGTTQYTGSVQALFVHHSAGSNSYSCSESPALLRGIQAYHVHSKGWNVIGYNVLVDKCGTLYEGRRGGITRPVLGAHTYGFNTDSAGIAVLGNYASIGVPAVTRIAIAQVAAYKMSMYGVYPGGRVTLTAGVTAKFPRGTRVSMARISGHRDAVQTECPGNSLYAQIPSIRALASGPTSGLALSGLAGAVHRGTAWHTRSAAKLSWSVNTPSALLRGFQVVVDGRIVGASSRYGRSTTLALNEGRHTVQVRAFHLAGSIAITPAAVLVVDRTAPTFPVAPDLALRTGTVGATVPVTLGWRAADRWGLSGQAVGGPRTAGLSGSATRLYTTAPTGAATWTVRAADPVRNVGSRSVTRTATVTSEMAATATGAWGRYASPAYLGGVARLSSTAGARLTWTMTGRSAAVVASRTPVSGQLRVSVDGSVIGTLDLRASRFTHRQIVWSRYFGRTGTHTVQLEVVGTAGRPAVAVDGFVAIG